MLELPQWLMIAGALLVIAGLGVPSSAETKRKLSRLPRRRSAPPARRCRHCRIFSIPSQRKPSHRHQRPERWRTKQRRRLGARRDRTTSAGPYHLGRSQTADEGWGRFLQKFAPGRPAASRQWTAAAGMVSIKIRFSSLTVTRRPVVCANFCATRMASSCSANSITMTLPTFEPSGLDMWKMWGVGLWFIAEPGGPVTVAIRLHASRSRPAWLFVRRLRARGQAGAIQLPRASASLRRLDVLPMT
jgi:hypothetical protein